MADKGEETRRPAPMARLKLQTNFGTARWRWSRGLAAEETKAATARAEQLAAVDNDPAARFDRLLRPVAITNLMSGDRSGRALNDRPETYLGEARNAGAVATTSSLAQPPGRA